MAQVLSFPVHANQSNPQQKGLPPLTDRSPTINQSFVIYCLLGLEQTREVLVSDESHGHAFSSHRPPRYLRPGSTRSRLTAVVPIGRCNTLFEPHFKVENKKLKPLYDNGVNQVGPGTQWYETPDAQGGGVETGLPLLLPRQSNGGIGVRGERNCPILHYCGAMRFV